MASIAIDSITKNANGTWTFEWTDGNPQSVWLNGDYLGEHTDTYTSGVFDTPPPIEIGAGAVTRTLAPWIEVTWRGGEPATKYRVQRLIETDWVDLTEILEDGRGTYTYRINPTLGTAYSLRVISDYGEWPSTVAPVTAYGPSYPPPLEVWYDTDTNEVVIEELR